MNQLRVAELCCERYHFVWLHEQRYKQIASHQFLSTKTIWKWEMMEGVLRNGVRSELTVTLFSAALSTGPVPCNSVEKLYQKNVNYSTSACHGKLILVQGLSFHSWQSKQTNKQTAQQQQQQHICIPQGGMGWGGKGRGGRGGKLNTSFCSCVK